MATGAQAASLVVKRRQNPTTSSATYYAGVAVGSSLDETTVKMARQARVGWIRTDVRFEPAFQTTYSLANKYAINVVGILDYATLAYNNGATLQDWKNVVAKAQTTYPLIHVWEIWNEPTLAQYQLGYMDGTPQRYFDLLKSAYTILKAGDAQSIVLGLGGAQIDYGKELNFANAVFSLGGATFMDAISIHAYPSYLNQGQNWNYYKQLWTQELQPYRSLGKPIWVTETGLTSDQLTEADQANYLTNSYNFFKEQGAAAFIWFQLVDFNQLWGLLHVDLSIKPSYVAYQTLLGAA